MPSAKMGLSRFVLACIDEIPFPSCLQRDWRADQRCGLSRANCKKKRAMDISTPLFVQKPKKQKGPWASVLPTVPDFSLCDATYLKMRESRRQPENVAPPPKLRFGFPKQMIIHRPFRHKSIPSFKLLYSRSISPVKSFLVFCFLSIPNIIFQTQNRKEAQYIEGTLSKSCKCAPCSQPQDILFRIAYMGCISKLSKSLPFQVT